MSVLEALEMPTLCGAWTCEFEPTRKETGNITSSGDPDSFELATPRWSMSFEMTHASNADLATMRAWTLRLRGSQTSFLAWDRKHPRPAAYFNVADNDSVTVDSTAVTVDSTASTSDETVKPWGAPRLTAINAGSRSIDTDGWSGAGLRAGDALSWFNGRNWVLVKSLETTTPIAGAITSLRVEPFIEADLRLDGYTLPLPLRVERACCEMKIAPGSLKVSSTNMYGGSVGFTAGQLNRRV